MKEFINSIEAGIGVGLTMLGLFVALFGLPEHMPFAGIYTGLGVLILKD